MKLSVFVSILGWASLVCLLWLMLLSRVAASTLSVVSLVVFFIMALIGGLFSMSPRK